MSYGYIAEYSCIGSGEYHRLGVEEVGDLSSFNDEELG